MAPTEEERAHWISVGRQIEREQSQALIEAEFDRRAELLRKEWEHELPVAGDGRARVLGGIYAETPPATPRLPPPPRTGVCADNQRQAQGGARACETCSSLHAQVASLQEQLATSHLKAESFKLKLHKVEVQLQEERAEHGKAVRAFEEREREWESTREREREEWARETEVVRVQGLVMALEEQVKSAHFSFCVCLQPTFAGLSLRQLMKAVRTQVARKEAEHCLRAIQHLSLSPATVHCSQQEGQDQGAHDKQLTGAAPQASASSRVRRRLSREERFALNQKLHQQADEVDEADQLQDELPSDVSQKALVPTDVHADTDKDLSHRERATGDDRNGAREKTLKVQDGSAVLMRRSDADQGAVDVALGGDEERPKEVELEDPSHKEVPATSPRESGSEFEVWTCAQCWQTDDGKGQNDDGERRRISVHIDAGRVSG